MPRKRRKFSAQFKADAVALVSKSGSSVCAVAKNLDLTESALAEWVKNAGKSATVHKAGGTLSISERAELEQLRSDVRRLQMERDFLKSGGLLCQGKQLKFAFIEQEKATFTVVFMCEQLGVSESGYYAWLTRGASAHDVDDVLLREEIRALHDASKLRYGSPRILKDLHASGRRI